MAVEEAALYPRTDLTGGTALEPSQPPEPKIGTARCGLRKVSQPTAIQFFHLQDRLGYNQPSEAVEWLIKAAADDIAQLPSLNSRSQHGFDSVHVDVDDHPMHPNYQMNQTQNQQPCLLKSACASNWETSKAPGLSFTDLLTGGHHQQNCNVEHVLFNKAAPQEEMDYSSFGSSFLGLSSTPARNHHQFSGDHHHSSSRPEMQHFSFLADYNPVPAAANGGDYNLNFSMSTSSFGGLAGFNGGPGKMG